MNEVVVDIIKNVTGFISYFAPGYIFLSCYCYASCLEREAQTEYLVIKCISISYIVLTVSQIIGRALNFANLGVQTISFILAMLVGFALGLFRRSLRANQISLKLLKREVSNSIFLDLWERANENNAVVYVVLTLKDEKRILEGQIAKIISLNSNPALQLAYYKILDSSNKLVYDCSNSCTAEVVVQYSDIKEFEYDIIPINNKIEG